MVSISFPSTIPIPPPILVPILSASHFFRVSLSVSVFSFYSPCLFPCPFCPRVLFPLPCPSPFYVPFLVSLYCCVSVSIPVFESNSGMFFFSFTIVPLPASFDFQYVFTLIFPSSSCLRFHFYDPLQCRTRSALCRSSQCSCSSPPCCLSACPPRLQTPDRAWPSFSCCRCLRCSRSSSAPSWEGCVHEKGCYDVG